MVDDAVVLSDDHEAAAKVVVLFDGLLALFDGGLRIDSSSDDEIVIFTDLLEFLFGVPYQFICQYSTAGVVTKVWSGIYQLVKGLSIFEIVFHANLLELDPEVLISERYSYVEGSLRKLFSVEDQLLILWILGLSEAVKQELFIHVAWFSHKACVALDGGVLWIGLRHAMDRFLVNDVDLRFQLCLWLEC